MQKPRVAILGSNSHIAKGLIYNFLHHGGYRLHCYTQSPQHVRRFLREIGKRPGTDCAIHNGYNKFGRVSHEVIINCVGVGTMAKLRGHYSRFFTVTEEYDNLAISYLRRKHPKALYISFSSGAVYGRACLEPAEENTVNHIRPNRVAPEDYYTIVRLNAEAKHRSLKPLNIVDLRLFSYFSRFIDLQDSYFITELLKCLQGRKTLITDTVDIIRDYVHPFDLFSIVRKCIAAGTINAAFDVTSEQPVSKHAILEYFASHYGLRYKKRRSSGHVSPTGAKKIYYSTYRNAARLGYTPKFSSLETIIGESAYILSDKKTAVGT